MDKLKDAVKTINASNEKLGKAVEVMKTINEKLKEINEKLKKVNEIMKKSR